MAAKNGKFHLQGFVKEQLEEAQKKFQALETEAERALKDLVSKGKAQRKELEALLERVNAGELFDPRSVKKWAKKAEQASADVLGRLDALQSRVVEAAGVASQSQVRDIHRELGKLTKKLDALTGKKAAPKVEPRV